MLQKVRRARRVLRVRPRADADDDGARRSLCLVVSVVAAVVVAAGLALFVVVVLLLRGRLVDQEALEAVVERDEAVLFLVGGADVELHDACRNRAAFIRLLFDVLQRVLVQRARQGCKRCRLFGAQGCDAAIALQRWMRALSHRCTQTISTRGCCWFAAFWP